jgi:hypothetical protein
VLIAIRELRLLKQRMDRGADGLRARQPSCEGIGQSGGGGSGCGGGLSLGFPADVERDAEIAVLRSDSGGDGSSRSMSVRLSANERMPPTCTV